jgi:hypothetical protein
VDFRPAWSGGAPGAIAPGGLETHASGRVGAITLLRYHWMNSSLFANPRLIAWMIASLPVSEQDEGSRPPLPKALNLGSRRATDRRHRARRRLSRPREGIGCLSAKGRTAAGGRPRRCQRDGIDRGR